MATDTFNFFNQFPTDLLNKVHNLGGDTLKVVLSNTAISATSGQLSDITQIATGNGYAAGGPTLDSNTVSATGATSKLTIADEVITATGGAIATFRYAVVYNDTATNDELIGWVDYGTGGVTLSAGQSFTLDFDASNGVFTLAFTNP